ncbi:protein kinase [Streptomyces sp. NPDC020412]|uniref:protein kinase domain-containing protein n=1 Tax=Streptomyces sp. NPDC020412 TaxID=3365073 RepID=UPI0037A9D627
MSQDGTQGRHVGASIAGGRYQLRDLLGEGGMASVYLAYDTALARQVAIKTLHTELSREQSFRERFRREAQAVANLSHTNIVSVYDTGEDVLGGAPMPYIVMEYVEGQPLGSVLQTDVQAHGAMPADRALKVTADVLAALETSHEVGLVHRDIKPGNVMVTKRGVVKVMDFGIARAVQSGVTSMTQTGMVVGTPQYLSPEQALGRGVDARSDLYSVGIMLFQLLTGRLPFDADSPLAIAYAHVQEEPVAPSTINRSITPAMDALVLRALRKNPNERFPSADAMRTEVLRVASAGQSAAPVIVSGTPAPSSGSGVGSAVFPPLGQGAAQGAAPHGVQAPYQPAPGPYGPATPPPGQPTPQPYGYPQQQHGQHAAQGYPQTGHAGVAHGQGVAHGHPNQHGQHGAGVPTPAPYAVSPQPHTVGGAGQGGGRGGRGKTAALVIVSGILGLFLVIGIVQSFTDPDKKKDDEAGRSGDPIASASADNTGSDGVIPPDRTRKLDADKCSDATEDSDDPSKVYAPDLRYRDVLSVKDCLRAAGWTWRLTEVDNPQYPKDAVVDQFPSPNTAVTPRSQEFELKVSTGKAG